MPIRVTANFMFRDTEVREPLPVEVLMNLEGENCQDTDQLKGQYANYFKVGHNAFEFLIDFGQFYQEGEQARFHSRIVTSPVYAKALLEILQGSIDRYEQSFGALPQENEEDSQHGG